MRHARISGESHNRLSYHCLDLIYLITISVNTITVCGLSNIITFAVIAVLSFTQTASMASKRISNKLQNDHYYHPSSQQQQNHHHHNGHHSSLRRSQSNSYIHQHHHQRRQGGYNNGNNSRHNGGRNRGGSLVSGNPVVDQQQQYPHMYDQSTRPYRSQSRVSFTVCDPVVVDLAQSSDDEPPTDQTDRQQLIKQPNNKENAVSLETIESQLRGADTSTFVQTCNKLKNCGRHKCQEVCHPGQCGDCQNIGWSELSCRCGSSVLYPPIPCGARPPPCNRKLCKNSFTNEG